MNEEELRILSLPVMQERIREAMGGWQKGDKFSVNKHEYFYSDGTWWYPGGIIPKSAIRLPLPIDPNNPERGLWGMCSGVVAIGEVLFKDSYFVTIRMTDSKGEYEKFMSHKGATPILAILKALCHQWKVEI